MGLVFSGHAGLRRRSCKTVLTARDCGSTERLTAELCKLHVVAHAKRGYSVAPRFITFMQPFQSRLELVLGTR